MRLFCFLELEFMRDWMIGCDIEWYRIKGINIIWMRAGIIETWHKVSNLTVNCI